MATKTAVKRAARPNAPTPPPAAPTRLRRLADSRAGRWAQAHPDLCAALLFAGLVFVYLWRVLLGIAILSPMTSLYLYMPWRLLTPPANLPHFFNSLLSDIPTSNYPWRVAARAALHRGELPQWFPNVFSGAPLMSNPQTGLFTPFNLPLWTLPLNYALGLSAAIKLWFGAFGTYLVVKQMRLGFLPGLLGGTAFAFCAFNITWLAHETLPAVAVMLPWMVWLVERLLERGRMSSVLWLGVVTAVGLGGGHPGAQVHLLALAALYAVVRVATIPELDRATRVRRLGMSLAGVALGVALMSALLIPEILSSHGTIGTSARANGRGTLPGTVMPFDAIKTVLFPDWWGRPSSVLLSAPPTSAGGLVNYNERTFYAGVVAALLAVVALVSGRDWRRKGPFVALAFVGLAIPVHTPGLWQLITHVPPFDLVQNQRIHFGFAFGAAILAAFGVRDLLDRPAELTRRLAVPAVAVVGGLLVVLSVPVHGGDIGHLFTHFFTGTSYASQGVIELTSATWFLIFSAGVGVAMLVAFRRPRWRYGAAIGLVLLAGGDALHFANGYQPMGPEDQVIPPKPPSVAFLQQHARGARVNALNDGLGDSWMTVYGLNDIRGYAPPNPTRRLFALWQITNGDQLDWTPLSMPAQDSDTVQVESVLGAKYIVTDPKDDEGASGDDLNPVMSALKVVYSADDATILENHRAAPRVEIPSKVILSSDEDDTETRIVEPSFLPSSQVIIESRDPAAQALASAPVARGSVRIADEKNSRVTLDATLDRPGLVVLNDSLMPGWTVKVDGRKADPVRVNSVMRGVVAGPGRHTVVWSYRTPGLLAGALLTFLGLLVVAVGGVALTLRSRRRRAADDGEEEAA